MYNLILKEFLVQKKVLLFGFIYIIFSAYAFQSIVPNGGAIYTLAPFAVVYILINYSCGYDDKNKTYIIFNSLPLKREDIVISKYLAVFAFAAYSIICSILLGSLGFYIGLPNFERLISLEDIVVVITGGALFASIFYPLYLKFGILKMKFANIVLFMAFMFIPSFLADYVSSHTNSAMVKNIQGLILNTPSLVSKTFLILIVLIIFLISLLISMKIYKGKDFE